MSARPDPSGGYHESGIPTGIDSYGSPWGPAARLRCYADALSACFPSPLRMCDRE
jgi:hypothetical protein